MVPGGAEARKVERQGVRKSNTPRARGWNDCHRPRSRRRPSRGLVRRSGLAHEVLAVTEREMIVLRPAAQRGRTDRGWLESRHTFSFGDYRDSHHMGFRRLRVINEHRVRPGGRFGTHSHADMEMLSYVLEGTLAHKDSAGPISVLRQH